MMDPFSTKKIMTVLNPNISYSYCTFENQKDSLFYPKHKNAVTDIGNYSKKFKCFDSEFLQMQGYYNSDSTRTLLIKFVKCNP